MFTGMGMHIYVNQHLDPPARLQKWEEVEYPFDGCVVVVFMKCRLVA
jgi:hypothetical protein